MINRFCTLAVFLCALSPGVWADDPDDDDGDGFGEASGDCDDGNADVYPGADEHCDGLDNDCDGAVDEGTECGDDDGDGFSEEEGDCDDADMTVHPLATETVDGVDEDCDGLIDNGTEVFDDDGDGFSEEEGDCDDANSEQSPGATDWCRDGLDNDCDGSVDDPCVEHPEDGCDPLMTVDLWTSAFSARPGTQLTVSADFWTEDLALDPEALWVVSDGAIEGEGLDAIWTLPEVEGTVQVQVFVTDSCGNETMDARDVSVQAETETLSEAEVYTEGCGGRQAWILCLLPVCLGWRRRLTGRPRSR